jgi:hypothetical protein
LKYWSLQAAVAEEQETMQVAAELVDLEHQHQLFKAVQII